MLTFNSTRQFILRSFRRHNQNCHALVGPVDPQKMSHQHSSPRVSAMIHVSRSTTLHTQLAVAHCLMSTPASMQPAEDGCGANVIS